MIDSLTNILNQSLKIDNNKVDLDNKNKTVLQANRYEYFQKENRVLQVDLLQKKINEIQTFKDLYFSKVMAIDQ